MMDRLATYLINLDGSHDRLSKASAALAGIGLEFERVAAFDGRGLPVASLPNYDPELARRQFGRSLSGGEIGCYLSHLNCAERFLASGRHYGLVLEDDLGVTPDTAATLANLLDWLDSNPTLAWDIANLGAPAQRYFVPVEGFAKTNPLCRAYYFPVTTTAILWSRPGAEAFCRDGQSVAMPIDHFLRKWATSRGRGLAFRQALFPDRQEQSEINQNNERAKARRHWGFWYSRQKRLWNNKSHAKRHLQEHMKQT